MSGAGTEDDLVWITEAMVKYSHSRGWFNRRIDNGTFTEEKKLGETKIYLHRSQIERYLGEHPEEEGQ
jgi:predicted DNA-binding transcriptional regulator AlpA